MTRLALIVIAAMLTSFAAHAADPAAAPAKTAPPAAAVPAAAPQKALATKTGLSQQDKMRECNKQATGKKGPERRAFMKTCLSKKA